jgi:polyisoprenoid-binding protein YceI
MKRWFVPVLAAAVAVSVGLSAQTSQQNAPLGPTQWRIDPAHSAANFSVRHLMVTTVRGQLGPITGTLEYDGKDVKTIKADVKIDVTGITTQNQKRDAHLRSPDFFDAAIHPVLTFKSKRVEPGTTKEVVLDVEGPSPVSKGMGGATVTGATATTSIKRLDYGLKWNAMVEAGPVVSDEVKITIDIEANRPGSPGTN